MVHAELPLQNRQVTPEVTSKLKYRNDFDLQLAPLYYCNVNKFLSFSESSSCLSFHHHFSLESSFSFVTLLSCCLQTAAG